MSLEASWGPMEESWRVSEVVPTTRSGEASRCFYTVCVKHCSYPWRVCASVCQLSDSFCWFAFPPSDQWPRHQYLSGSRQAALYLSGVGQEDPALFWTSPRWPSHSSTSRWGHTHAHVFSTVKSVFLSQLCCPLLAKHLTHRLESKETAIFMTSQKSWKSSKNKLNGCLSVFLCTQAGMSSSSPLSRIAPSL